MVVVPTRDTGAERDAQLVTRSVLRPAIRIAGMLARRVLLKPDRPVNLVIVVPLQSTDWKPPFHDGGKGEWSCRALALPTAEFRCLRRPDDSVVPAESYEVRGTRISWKGGGRPQGGMKVEIGLASGLHSRAALVGSSILGLAAGLYLAPKVDLGQVVAVVEAQVAQVWALLG